MIFRNDAADSPILSELRNYSVIQAAEWDKFCMPDEGDLTEVLVANAERIDQNRWIYWLVKRHNFTRVPKIEPDMDFIESVRWTPSLQQFADFYGVYPLKVRGDMLHLAAVRPDAKTVLSTFHEWLGTRQNIMFALTPLELLGWRKELSHIIHT